MYVCTYVCMYVCMYVCIYVCTYVCMYVCMFVCIYVCMYICMYCVCMYVRIQEFMYILCMYVCMYVCVYVYTRIYVCKPLCVPLYCKYANIMQPLLLYVLEISCYNNFQQKSVRWDFNKKCRYHKTCFSSIAANISGRMGRTVGLNCKASVITHARWSGIILAKFSTSLVLLALVD